MAVLHRQPTERPMFRLRRYACGVSNEAETDPRVIRARAAGRHRDRTPAVGAHPGVSGDPLSVRRTLIEQIIIDAQADGRFDDLPFQGERLPLADDSAAGELAAAFRILRNADAAPHWIEVDREIRRLLGEREGVLDRAQRAGVLFRDRYRAQLRRLVADMNRLVVVLNHEAPTMKQHRRPLDLERELAELERRWPR